MPRNEIYKDLFDNRVREADLRAGMLLECGSTYAIVTKDLNVVDLDDGRVIEKKKVVDNCYVRVAKGTVLRLTAKV